MAPGLLALRHAGEGALASSARFLGHAQVHARHLVERRKSLPSLAFPGTRGARLELAQHCARPLALRAPRVPSASAASTSRARGARFRTKSSNPSANCARAASTAARRARRCRRARACARRASSAPMGRAARTRSLVPPALSATRARPCRRWQRRASTRMAGLCGHVSRAAAVRTASARPSASRAGSWRAGASCAAARQTAAGQARRRPAGR